jgi:hypothetical protein
LELIVFLGGDDGLLKIVSADPVETAVEYRRKGEPIGFFLNLRLIVLPGAYGQRDDGSKSQKLPRITTQESPILWKFAESLEIRVTELKTRNPPTLRQHLQEIDAEISKMEGQHNLGMGEMLNISARAKAGESEERENGRLTGLSLERRLTFSQSPSIKLPRCRRRLGKARHE